MRAALTRTATEAGRRSLLVLAGGRLLYVPNVLGHATDNDPPAAAPAPLVLSEHASLVWAAPALVPPALDLLADSFWLIERRRVNLYLADPDATSGPATRTATSLENLTDTNLHVAPSSAVVALPASVSFTTAFAPACTQLLGQIRDGVAPVAPHTPVGAGGVTGHCSHLAGGRPGERRAGRGPFHHGVWKGGHGIPCSARGACVQSPQQFQMVVRTYDLGSVRGPGWLGAALPVCQQGLCIAAQGRVRLVSSLP